MLRLAAQSWVDGFPNLRFFRYAIVPLVVSLRGKPNDAKVTFFHVFDTFLYRLAKAGFPPYCAFVDTNNMPDAKAGFPKCPRTAFG